MIEPSKFSSFASLFDTPLRPATDAVHQQNHGRIFCVRKDRILRLSFVSHAMFTFFEDLGLNLAATIIYYSNSRWFSDI